MEANIYSQNFTYYFVAPISLDVCVNRVQYELKHPIWGQPPLKVSPKINIESIKEDKYTFDFLIHYTKTVGCLERKADDETLVYGITFVTTQGQILFWSFFTLFSLMTIPYFLIKWQLFNLFFFSFFSLAILIAHIRQVNNDKESIINAIKEALSES